MASFKTASWKEKRLLNASPGERCVEWKERGAHPFTFALDPEFLPLGGSQGPGVRKDGREKCPVSNMGKATARCQVWTWGQKRWVGEGVASGRCPAQQVVRGRGPGHSGLGSRMVCAALGTDPGARQTLYRQQRWILKRYYGPSLVGLSG